MNLRTQLERLVQRHAKVQLAAVADEDVLGHELGLDSHALLALLLDVEDAFQLEITAEQTARLAGIRFADFVALVDRGVAAAHAPDGSAP
jgi:acyl carrier protein